MVGESKQMGKGLMTPDQAALHAGVSRSLIYQWCHERLLPHYRLGAQGRRGRILIDPADLDRLIRQCRVSRHLLADDLE